MFNTPNNYIYNRNLNNLGFWYPILKDFGIPTPETYIITHNVDLISIVSSLGEKKKNNDKELEKLINDIDFYANKVGYPCFLRTGQTSNKHDWKNSCFLEKKEDIFSHLMNLSEMSIMADMMKPLDTNTIVIRKLIETDTQFISFNNMPITKEVRCFIETDEKGNRIYNVRPYWPLEAFEGKTFNIDGKSLEKNEIKKSLDKMYKLTENEKLFFNNILTFLSKELKEDWSIDFLQDKNGEWYCIDMAIAEMSYKSDIIINIELK